MRVAFSKPTAGDEQFTRLLTGFRRAGYEGLQLKMGQFLPWLEDPDGFRRTWGDDTAQVSGLIVFDTLEPAGVDRLRAAVRFASEVGGERIVFCHDHPRAGVTDADIGAFARQLSTIGAGADTTAGTLTYTLYLLCTHPAAAHALQQELDDAMRQGSLTNPPKWSQVNRLPYLEAVLKESMRIIPIASWGLDRIVPTGGATVSGQYLPGGTVVGCNIDAVHLDEDVYGQDAAAFRPERWLEADEDQRRRMDRAFLAFSAGKRTCTGIHIAWLEMKKTLPLLLMNFEVSVAISLQKNKHDMLTIGAFQMELVNPGQDVRGEVRISAVKYPPPILMHIRKRERVEVFASTA